MKKIIYSILIGIATSFAHAQTVPIEHEWNVTLKVLDESGQPKDLESLEEVKEP